MSDTLRPLPGWRGAPLACAQRLAALRPYPLYHAHLTCPPVSPALQAQWAAEHDGMSGEDDDLTEEQQADLDAIRARKRVGALLWVAGWRDRAIVWEAGGDACTDRAPPGPGGPGPAARPVPPSR